MSAISSIFLVGLPSWSTIALMLFGCGLLLILAELALPTQAILGVLGAICLLGGVAACFIISPAFGLLVLLALVIATPFAISLFVRVWPKTRVGRKMVLSEVSGRINFEDVSVGEVGMTLSEMRPMGECEFDGKRVEAISEQGLIAPGSRVKVIGLSDHRPVVQPVETT
jgi:membrane-bound ClpP family serine protease